VRIQIHRITYMLIQIRPFTFILIRILMIKLMQICDHWSTDTPRLYFISSRHSSIVSVHGSILSLLASEFDFNADPDPAFHSNTDSDLQSWYIL
jgi:hypothetical protein